MRDGAEPDQLRSWRFWCVAFLSGSAVCFALTSHAEEQNAGPDTDIGLVERSEALEVEAKDLVPPSCSELAASIPAPEKSNPVVSVNDFGAKGDGVTDDTAAINAAIQSMKSGGTVVFEPGRTYIKTRNIVMNKPKVKLWGYGAVLYSRATREDLKKGKGGVEISIQLRAPDTGVFGVTMISNLRKRLIGHPNQAAVFVIGPRQSVIDSHFEYTGNGVLVREGTDFLIARNVVYRTTSDGIHVTTRSQRGRILCNTVRETGDDMIAVVNYGRGEPNIGDFLIEGNDVAGQYWGRGITVVGGKDVTIRSNTVADTTHGAGIMVAGDPSYKTADVRNVLVERNTITGVQTSKPRYSARKDLRTTGHAAIEINAPADYSIRNLLVRDNKVSGAARDGIRVRGNACDIGLLNNSLTGVRGDPLRIEIRDPTDCLIGCTGNTKDGAPITAKVCNDTMPEVTGSSLGR
jgi:polygalacturonase